MVFGDREMIDQIGEKATFFHVDATFGVVPGYLPVLKVRSSQVLNFVAEYGTAVVSVVTVVMTCRKVGLYRKIFSFLRREFPCLQPKQIMADWEVSLRKTVAEAFPNARVLGCW